jgi:hypothetical protein
MGEFSQRGTLAGTAVVTLLDLVRLTGKLLLCGIFILTDAYGQTRQAGIGRIGSTTVAGRELRITLQSGGTFVLPLEDGSCSFEEVQVADDGVTVGWLERGTAQMANDPPCLPDSIHVSEGPIIWRAGKILRRFSDDGVLMDWQFQGKGDLVALHAGPEHFDNDMTCKLYDIATGQLVKSWDRSQKRKLPDWAKGLVDDPP